jgi:hypothetical protein
MDIDKTNYKIGKRNIWDKDLETGVAIFVNCLARHSEGGLKFNKAKVAKELLEKYVRKNSNSIVSATPYMREIMDLN